MNSNQIKAYLERIRFKKEPEISEHGLGELIWANLTAIPFENVDVKMRKVVPSLEETDLYEKIVVKKRGGYCFELNKLFMEFLKGCGFSAWPVAVRILWMRQELPAATHRGSIVKIKDRLYYADVGYGGPGPKGVVELKEGIVSVRDSRFRISIPQNGTWLIEREYKDSFSPMLFFEEKEAMEADFQLANFYCARCDKVLFTHTLVCSLLAEDASYALVGNKFTIQKGDQIEERKLQSEDELEECLYSMFGIRFDQ